MPFLAWRPRNSSVPLYRPIQDSKLRPYALAGRVAFQHLLDEIDAAPRSVELVAQQLVGRAGGVAETAVHALAQDRVGFTAEFGIPNLFC